MKLFQVIRPITFALYLTIDFQFVDGLSLFVMPADTDYSAIVISPFNTNSFTKLKYPRFFWSNQF